MKNYYCSLKDELHQHDSFDDFNESKLIPIYVAILMLIVSISGVAIAHGYLTDKQLPLLVGSIVLSICITLAVLVEILYKKESIYTSLSYILPVSFFRYIVSNYCSSKLESYHQAINDFETSSKSFVTELSNVDDVSNAIVKLILPSGKELCVLLHQFTDDDSANIKTIFVDSYKSESLYSLEIENIQNQINALLPYSKNLAFPSVIS